MNPRPVLILLGINIFLSVALPGISLLGHLGGLVVGALTTAAIVYAPRNKNIVRFQVWACVGIAVALIAVIGLRVGVMDSCELTPDNQYISCSSS
jgi:membrane associated rhomboid family serine protease